MPEPTRHPPSTCRRCGKALDAATGVTGAHIPRKGDVSFCAYCGTVSIFDDQQHLHPPSEAEIVEVLADARFVAMLDRMINHFGVEIPDGVAMRCGCRINWGEQLFTVVACAPDCLVAHRVLKMASDSGKPYSVIR